MSETWIEIFRTGRHMDSSGKESEWREDDLDQIVQNYDPGYHEAPAVVGHPKTDSPAYGWVDKLKREGQNLLARFRQVQPQFLEAFNAGLYKKRSAAFYYLPDKGWYLRHVGFLGAQPPAVKGLADAVFADAGRGDVVTVEYSEKETIGGMFRRLRDWFIEQFGVESADRVLPGWEIDYLCTPEPEPEDRFNEPQEVVMEDKTKEIQDLQARLDALTREKTDAEAKFAEAQAKLAEENRKLQDKIRRDEIGAKLEALQKSGKLTPALVKLGLPEFMAGLDEANVVEFAEGAKESQAAFMLRFLEAMPAMPLFTEQATAARAASAPVQQAEIPVDAKSKIDPERAALDAKIRAMCQEKGIAYAEAARQILK